MKSVVACAGLDGRTSERNDESAEVDLYYCYSLYSHESYLGVGTIVNILCSEEVVRKLSEACGDDGLGRSTARCTTTRVCSWDVEYVECTTGTPSCLAEVDVEIDSSGGGAHVSGTRVYFLP